MLREIRLIVEQIPCWLIGHDDKAVPTDVFTRLICRACGRIRVVLNRDVEVR